MNERDRGARGAAERDPVRGGNAVPSPSRLAADDAEVDAELPAAFTTPVPPDERVPDAGGDKDAGVTRRASEARRDQHQPDE